MKLSNLISSSNISTNVYASTIFYKAKKELENANLHVIL